MSSSYFISYYWRNSFFKRGFGWVETVCPRIKSSNDLHKLQKIIKKDKKLKKVIILNFQIISAYSFEIDNKPFWPLNDGA